MYARMFQIDIASIKMFDSILSCNHLYILLLYSWKKHSGVNQNENDTAPTYDLIF